jgi:hypothetical protein
MLAKPTPRGCGGSSGSEMGMYQSTEDEENERRIGAEFCEFMGVSIIATPKGASMDYVMHKDGVLWGIGECKARRGKYSYERMQELGSIMLDYEKVRIARIISKKMMVNFYFVVELTNALLYLEVRWNRDFEPSTKNMRLNVVRDVNDRDEVVLLPIEKFTVIKHDPETIPAEVA